MSDIYELTKQFQQDKLRRTMLEMERVGREAQGRQGGLDPFTAEELGKRASPYYRTRAEIDQDIASINALAADYAAAQKALRSATTTAEKQAAEKEKLRVEYEIAKNRSGSTSGDVRFEGLLEAEGTKRDQDIADHREKVVGDGRTRLTADEVQVLSTGKGATVFDPAAGAFNKLLGSVKSLAPAEAKNMIQEYSDAAGLTPEDFRKRLAANAASEVTGKTAELNKAIQDVDARHAELVAEYPPPEEVEDRYQQTVRSLGAGADWGEYPGGDAAGGMTQAEWDRQRAMARAGGPFDADKRALADEVMAEDAPETPYRDAWEEYTSTPEFIKEAEGLWGKKGPFTEAEERVVFRKLKQRGRQEAGAARKEGRGLELGGRASAEAAVPAAAAETETPVTEAPEETVPEAAESFVSLEGDSFEYKFGETDASIRSPGGKWRPMSDEEIGVLFENMTAAPGEVTVTGAPLPGEIAAATGVVSGLPEAPVAEILPAPTAAPEAPVAPPTVADLAQQSIMDRYDTSWMSKPLAVDEVEMLPEEEEQAALDVAKMPEPPQPPPGFAPKIRTPGRSAGQQAWQEATQGLVAQERLNRAAMRKFGR